MNKYKFISYLFVLLGLLVMAGASYLIISYASDILKAIVDFVTSNDLARLQQCGISTPPQFNKIKTDLTTTILPFMYVGLPILFIVISFIMFLAGMYYNKGKHQDEVHKTEEMEREMVHKLVKKIETEKPAAPKSASPRMEEPPEEPIEEAAEEEASEETEGEGPEEEEPVRRAPAPKSAKRRR